MLPMSPSRQSGAALMAAIFLLVVIAALTAFLVKMSGLQHSSAALDVQGARAFQAARTGIDWAVYRVLRDPGCPAPSSFGLGGGLSDFTVTVQCVDTGYTEIDATVKTVSSITATACNRPDGAGDCPGLVGSFYVERQLQALVDRVN